MKDAGYFDNDPWLNEEESPSQPTAARIHRTVAPPQEADRKREATFSLGVVVIVICAVAGGSFVAGWTVSKWISPTPPPTTITVPESAPTGLPPVNPFHEPRMPEGAPEDSREAVNSEPNAGENMPG